MERAGTLQAATVASALSVKTKFPLGQDRKRFAGQYGVRIGSSIPTVTEGSD